VTGQDLALLIKGMTPYEMMCAVRFAVDVPGSLTMVRFDVQDGLTWILFSDSSINVATDTRTSVGNWTPISTAKVVKLLSTVEGELRT
jgi:hypothetical protein